MPNPRSRLRWTAALLVSLAGVPGTAGADPVTTSTLGWAVNGIVSEVARAGNVAYVGGAFETVAPSANLVFGFATFAADAAVPVLPRLDVNDRVRAVVALPGGGWLIGGDFTQVNGASRHRLARLLPDGTLDPSFSLAANDTVWALLVAGTRVFVGGEFTQVGTTPRLRVAALDAATLALDVPFAPQVEGSGASVCALAISGGTLFIGGSFATVNGAAQANLGAVETTAGTTVAAFTGTADGRVNQLALHGSSLFAAGEFHSIGGQARRGVARLSATTGTADAAFDATVNGSVSGLAVAGATVFVAGSFGQAGGQGREHLAQLDATTGLATPWKPGADGDVESIALIGPALIVAGHFHETGGAERLNLAALSASGTSNLALPWNPSLNSSAEYVHVDAAGHVFVSGHFNFYGAVPRENLAAIDLLTGDLLPWNPGANGWVRALDIAGNLVYIGGDFSTIGGVSRSRIAALDVVTGVVTSWTAEPSGRVKGLMVHDGAVYFVGEFSQVKNSTSRGRGAAVAFDGTVLPWNPAANGTIESLFVTADRVYLGGEFTTLGGVSHPRLAAVDRSTGAEIATFDPAVSSGNVIRVDVQDDVVYFGGTFGMVNGSTRNNAAAVRIAHGMPADGELLAWNPNVGGPVYDIDAVGEVVYLAGGFGSVGGSSRPGIAMVDADVATGTVRSWRPVDVSGGSVSVIDTSATAVLFGGLLRDLNHIDIGAVLYPEANLPGTPPPPTTPDVVVRGSRLTLSWSPPPLGARPTAYVIEGGSGPGQRDLANFSTGSASTSFSANGLAAGTYYLRLRSQNAAGVGAASLEQAFVVGVAGCSGPPAPPLDIRAAVSGSSVTLTWRASPQSIVTGYRLLAGTTSGTSNVGAFTLGPVTSYTTPAPTGAFFVRVQAVNACGMSVPSAEAVAVVGGATAPPGAPFGLAATVTGAAVQLNWASPSIGTGPFTFRVEAGSASGLANIAQVMTSATSFMTTGVPPGTYYVRVRAIGVAGVGPAGNEVVVVVAP